MTWIQTLDAGAYDYLAALRGQHQRIDLHELAYALAGIPRYTGHSRPRITVAEHSVAVARRVVELCQLERRTDVRRIVRCAMMHDGGESVTGDVNRPLKMVLRTETTIFDRLESAVEADIARSFNLEWDDDAHRIVKQADNEACAWEKEFIMGPGPREREWEWLPPIPANDWSLRVVGLTPARAYELFTDECMRWGIENEQ